jgi:histidine ammonia-lyase
LSTPLIEPSKGSTGATGDLRAVGRVGRTRPLYGKL